MDDYRDCMWCGMDLGRNYKEPIVCDVCHVTQQMEDSFHQEMNKFAALISEICEALQVSIPQEKNKHVAFMLDKLQQHIHQNKESNQTNTNFVLSYHYQQNTDNESGPGYYWKEKSKIFTNKQDLNEALEELWIDNTKAQTLYDGRPNRNFDPPYKNIKVHSLNKCQLFPYDILMSAPGNGGDVDGDAT